MAWVLPWFNKNRTVEDALIRQPEPALPSAISLPVLRGLLVYLPIHSALQQTLLSVLDIYDPFTNNHQINGFKDPMETERALWAMTYFRWDLLGLANHAAQNELDVASILSSKDDGLRKLETIFQGHNLGTGTMRFLQYLGTCHLHFGD